MSNIDTVLKKLNTLKIISKTHNLKDVKLILQCFDNPQNDFKTIHIAGTNGKGTTSSMLESILIEAGHKVGKYSSPHLIKINERIAINKKMISDKDFCDYFVKLEKIVGKLSLNLTFFETVTLIMFLYFSDKKIDWLILEVGLGGEFDATNVVNSSIDVITSISMDHRECLGPSLKDIALSKSGIIKNNNPVFFYEKRKDIINIIKSKTPFFFNLYEHNKNFETILDKNDLSTIVMNKKNNISYKFPLYGEFHLSNFLLSYCVAKHLKIDTKIIKSGLSKMELEARFEKIFKNPDIILDVAHNEEASFSLAENIKTIYSKKETILIISILKDKEIESILKNFSKISETVIFVSLDKNKRGLSETELYNIGYKYFKKSYAVKTVEKSLILAKKIDKKVIVATGSFYLIGEIKKIINKNNFQIY